MHLLLSLDCRFTAKTYREKRVKFNSIEYVTYPMISYYTLSYILLRVHQILARAKTISKEQMQIDKLTVLIRSMLPFMYLSSGQNPLQPQRILPRLLLSPNPLTTR